MDYKELARNCEARAASFRMQRNREGAMHEFQCSRSITDLLARAEAAEDRAEKAERERDAAVDQLRGDCEKCTNYRVTWNGCTPDYECPLSDRCLNRDMWEWNGGEKEE